MTDLRSSEAQGAEDDGRGFRRLLGRSVRALLLATGLAVFVVGVLIVFRPEVGELVPVQTAVEALGSDYVVVAVVGLLAVGLAAVVLAGRRLRGVREASPPVVEGVQSATYPGERLDRSAAGRSGYWDDGSGRRDRLERLEEAATRATMRADGCSRRVAERRVTEGRWTEDAVAGTYLSEHSSWSADWIRRITGREERAFRRTVDAIERRSDGGAGSGGEANPDVNAGGEGG
jgi:hypothetical protein